MLLSAKLTSTTLHQSLSTQPNSLVGDKKTYQSMASPITSDITPRPKWVLVYDWNERVIWETLLDRLGENASQVFPIPSPSYILDIYGLRIDLSSHPGFEELHVINTPPGFCDTGHRSYAASSYRSPKTPRLTPFSAWPQDSASNISSTSELGSSDAKLDVHRSNTQTPSDTSESSPNILHAISENITRVYQSSTGGYHAVFTIRWELDQYLETELDFDPVAPAVKSLLEPVLTITGTSGAPYATTAISYLEWAWPDGGAPLLSHLRDWAGNEGTGRSSPLNWRVSTSSNQSSSSGGGD